MSTGLAEDRKHCAAQSRHGFRAGHDTFISDRAWGRKARLFLRTSTSTAPLLHRPEAFEAGFNEKRKITPGASVLTTPGVFSCVEQKHGEEIDLVRRAQAGDRAAFDQLAGRYRAALRAMAFPADQ